MCGLSGCSYLSGGSPGPGDEYLCRLSGVYFMSAGSVWYGLPGPMRPAGPSPLLLFIFNPMGCPCMSRLYGL